MNIVHQLSSYILPKEINFFQSLYRQAEACHHIASDFLCFLETQRPEDLDRIFTKIQESKNERKKNLKELHQAFITPIDKEVINRCYNQFYQIELSFKHLIIEIKTYQKIDIEFLTPSFVYIKEITQEIQNGFAMIEQKKLENAIDIIENIFHLSNQFSYTYAKELNDLFSKEDVYLLHVNRELLSQFKSLIQHCLSCSNQMSDIIFKLS